MNKYNVEGVSTEEARAAVIDDLTFHNRKDIEILSVECVL